MINTFLKVKYIVSNIIILYDIKKIVIKEMNRLGMMVDISHVSRKTMRDALRISKAPIIFSHSSAYAICNHTRNVPDDILELVVICTILAFTFFSIWILKSFLSLFLQAKNEGIVMVNFFPKVISCGRSKANLHGVIGMNNYSCLLHIIWP